MQSYKDIVSIVMAEGEDVDTRLGKARRISHEFITMDLRLGFPLLTARKMHVKGIAAELACFLRGHTDIREFESRGCNYWRKDLNRYNEKHNTPNNNNLGRIYGAQYRNWNHHIDQLRNVLAEAKTDPGSRRLVVTLWNPSEIHQMTVPPCYTSWQISIVGDFIDLCWTQRSVDLALGAPSDIASMALLTHLIGNELGKTPRRLTGFFVDGHIYHANFEGVEQYLSQQSHKLPVLTLAMKPGAQVETFEPEMMKLTNYIHGPFFKMEMQ
jgi:thymidylate synthase